MASRLEALVNPEMLILARKQCGFDLNAAAKKLGNIKSEQLERWEKGETRPTINQAMKMAEVYHRPLSFFYLTEPPKDFTVAITDYRHISVNNLFSSKSPGFLWEKRQAETRREVMLDLAETDDDGVFEYLNSISLSDDPKTVAMNVREWLGIDWSTQMKWKEYNEALAAWKEAVENLNVLVFHTNHQGLTFTLEECRGFSISASRFPVIVVNSSDAGGARIFTLMHELVHLLLNASGICDCEEYSYIQTSEQRVETFCNRVAGEILVPEQILLSHRIVQNHRNNPEWDDEEIFNLAGDFSTSEDVIVRRLLILKRTSQEFYEMKHSQYNIRWLEFREKRRQEGRKFGPPHYRMVLRKNGGAFTRQVFSAYNERQITLLDASYYLGVKVRYLRDIEREAFKLPTGA
jgi:Zn-dependent peptidase ImmA (M78 family)/transcriptional regulator with XRE-family HTH domain